MNCGEAHPHATGTPRSSSSAGPTSSAAIAVGGLRRVEAERDERGVGDGGERAQQPAERARISPDSALFWGRVLSGASPRGAARPPAARAAERAGARVPRSATGQPSGVGGVALRHRKTEPRSRGRTRPEGWTNGDLLPNPGPCAAGARMLRQWGERPLSCRRRSRAAAAETAADAGISGACACLEGAAE
eukprot:gene971-biopygen3892